MDSKVISDGKEGEDPDREEEERRRRCAKVGSLLGMDGLRMGNDAKSRCECSI
jgi:hypothetical protein